MEVFQWVVAVVIVLISLPIGSGDQAADTPILQAQTYAITGNVYIVSCTAANGRKDAELTAVSLQGPYTQENVTGTLQGEEWLCKTVFSQGVFWKCFKNGKNITVLLQTELALWQTKLFRCTATFYNPSRGNSFFTTSTGLNVTGNATTVAASTYTQDTDNNSETVWKILFFVLLCISVIHGACVHRGKITACFRGLRGLITCGPLDMTELTTCGPPDTLERTSSPLLDTSEINSIRNGPLSTPESTRSFPPYTSELIKSGLPDTPESIGSGPPDTLSSTRSGPPDTLSLIRSGPPDTPESTRSDLPDTLSSIRSGPPDTPESIRSGPPDMLSSIRSGPPDTPELMRSGPPDMLSSSRSGPPDTPESTRSYLPDTLLMIFNASDTSSLASD